MLCPTQPTLETYYITKGANLTYDIQIIKYKSQYSTDVRTVLRIIPTVQYAVHATEFPRTVQKSRVELRDGVEWVDPKSSTRFRGQQADYGVRPRRCSIVSERPIRAKQQVRPPRRCLIKLLV
eukprot:8838954-Pyramimonas_sp.AAC.2